MDQPDAAPNPTASYATQPGWKISRDGSAAHLPSAAGHTNSRARHPGRNARYRDMRKHPQAARHNKAPAA